MYVMYIQHVGKETGALVYLIFSLAIFLDARIIRCGFFFLPLCPNDCGDDGVFAGKSLRYALL